MRNKCVRIRERLNNMTSASDLGVARWCFWRVWSTRQSLTFRGNKSPPSSGSENKPSWKLAEIGGKLSFYPSWLKFYYMTAVCSEKSQNEERRFSASNATLSPYLDKKRLYRTRILKVSSKFFIQYKWLPARTWHKLLDQWRTFISQGRYGGSKMMIKWISILRSPIDC
jgi:hypothetical protein